MSLDAPEQATVTVRRPIPRRYVALVLIVVAVILLATLVAIRDNKANDSAASETFTLAPPSVIAAVTDVPTATIDAVGTTSTAGPITPLTSTGGHSLWLVQTQGGKAKPVVFFYGAEFAPYAAAERWPVLEALSRFGTFGPVGLMQSSGSVAFSNTSTFTFSHTTFRSRWISLQTVERYSALNPTGGHYMKLQTPTPRQAAAVAQYDAPASTFPLLDVANRFVLVGSSFSPSVLASQNQSQIATDLAIPTSPVTEAIVASANEITASICTVTGDRPAGVCHARGVNAAESKLGIPDGAS